MHLKKAAIDAIDKVVKIDDSPAFKAFDTLNSEYQKLTSEKNELMSSSIRTTIVVTLIGVFSALMVTILINFIIGKSVINPIGIIAASLSSIAGGDLRTTISYKSKDEMGMLSQDMNRMVESFSGIINNLLAASNSVVSSVDILRVRAQKTADGARNQSGQAHQIATAVDQQSAAAEQVARSIGRTQSISKEVEKMSDDTAHEVNTLTKTAEELRNSTSEFKTKGSE